MNVFTDCIFPIRLSLQVACVSTVALIIVSVPLAYIFARGSFPGKRIIEALFLMPLVLPPTVIGYYLVILLGRNGLVGHTLFSATGWTPIFSWWGAVIASGVVAFPLLFLSSCSAIEAVDPRLEQAAHTLGTSKLSTICRVTIPLAKKRLLAGVALAFARAMGEFGATMMIAGDIPGRTNTMPLTIYTSFASGNFSQANTLAIIYTLVSLVSLYYITSARKAA